MTTQWLLVGVVILLLLASAFFVAAEFALVSARRTVVEPLAVNSARARVTLKAMEDISVMMATAQLGITLCGVLLGALGEPAVATLLEPVFHALGVPDAALHPVALVVALLLVVSAHVALGEMVPKNIALAGPERTAMLLAPALMAVATAIGPVVRGLNHVANEVVRKLGKEPKDEVASAFTREEVADLVAESRAEGLLDEDEHQLITSALDFEGNTLATVLLPDDQVVALDQDATPAEVERLCARTGFSRFPIKDAQGRYRGYVHIRDVVAIDPERRDEPLPPESIRALPAFAEGTDLRAALDRMRRAGAHLAQVAADPTRAQAQRLAGRPLARPAPEQRRGLVMLEDVIEQLIGEIGDATRRG
ncbi:hemolysin family protein [Nakamurella aerolata]|uniref:HlyC/CorC family transporter n=1 Tax=Nakamurella aerolata TaxID=1656892 RepID=A0A849A328_9ACTN|nr:hemolysin family protein [Nakamurella aerolata]NNG34477.1 HlyC/CorC family transporter [Nakamurella aerolata]